ncbi:cobW-domain-containing protein [Linderina pennispora]|uniref:CobW-domain-containing protein n=1 Tax=Linderina pennispora TaxID=61395 RepID=A0A1Y1WKS5_9FUNG|nr:cobW-domain-containing protein [Linderina pennispora]ORX73965.1 cobW-domain-containing protein [Linderina pennispora]
MATSDPNKIVPATILTGYLGSGKTTLLNYILQAEHGKRIAVIMNEFGDSQGIDQAFTTVTDEGAMVDEWLDLKNGCLCCTVKDKGLKAIESLMERKGKFDYILLETYCDIRLDGIVTLVDAKNFDKELNEPAPEGETMNECQKQALARIEQTIGEINSEADIRRSQFAGVPLDYVLNINAYSSVTTKHAADTEHGHHHHVDSRIGTVAMAAPALVQWEIVDEWIQELLWDARIPGTSGAADGMPATEVLRLKALLGAKDYIPVGGETKLESATVVVQGVREMYDSFSVPAHSDDGLLKLVVIGRNVDEDKLRSSWAQLLAKATVSV